MRIMVTGKTGQLVRALGERAVAEDATILTLGRPEFDLAEPSGLPAILRDIHPDVVVSAAAYTAVDRAEDDAATAFAVNADGPAALARACAGLGIALIHLSTDYVFDGYKAAPYLEDDPTAPLGVYGKSKLAGEQAVRAELANHAILRTAWVYSPFGHNFAKTMLRLAGSQPTVRVVADQIGTPTAAHELADAVLAVARNLVRSADSKLRGTFHAVNAGVATWADFAEEIFAQSAHLGGPSSKVERISTAEYRTPVARPKNSCLDAHKLYDVHGVKLPDWREPVAAVVCRLLNERLA